MARFKSKEILLVGLKGEKGKDGIGTVDTELSTESENPVQNKVVTEAVNNKVDTWYDKDMSIQYVYTNEVAGGVRSNKVRRFSSALTDDKYTYFIGSLPTYRGVGGSTAPQLTTGTPAQDFSAVNLKYFNANKGTKLYKHTINVNCTNFSFDIQFYSVKNNTDSVEYYNNEHLDINADGIISEPYIVIPDIDVLKGTFTISTSSLDHAIYQFVFEQLSLGEITIESVVETYAGV